MFSGKPKYEGLVWEMHHPRVDTLADEEDEPVGQDPARLSADRRLAAVADAEDRARGRGEIRGRARRGLSRRSSYGPRPVAAPPGIAGRSTFPTIRESLDRARRRFVYQELFILQLALAVRRQQQHDQRQAPCLEATAKIDARIRRLFPFELTAGQQQAMAEIAADMAGPLPMNRLLQGDVGSGKTVVAVYAMLLAVAHGHQAALMAPTEILARQHAMTLEKLLAASQVRRAQLTGGLTRRRSGAALLATDRRRARSTWSSARRPSCRRT